MDGAVVYVAHEQGVAQRIEVLWRESQAPGPLQDGSWRNQRFEESTRRAEHVNSASARSAECHYHEALDKSHAVHGESGQLCIRKRLRQLEAAVVNLDLILRLVGSVEERLRSGCSDGEARVVSGGVIVDGDHGGVGIHTGVPAADRAIKRVEDERSRPGFAVLRDDEAAGGVGDNSCGCSRPRRCGRNGHDQVYDRSVGLVNSGQSGDFIGYPERAAWQISLSPSIFQIWIL